jgi:hypothetical protein
VHSPGLGTRVRRRMHLILVAALLLAPGVLSMTSASAAATMSETPTTYRDFYYGDSRTDNATNDKAQSKLWWNDGSWWSLMVNPADSQVQIFELMPDHAWRATGTVVDNRATSNGDALWDGNKLYVASNQASSPLRVVRFSYDAGARRYVLDAGFPVNVNSGGSKSAAIAKDSTGKLWVTYTRSGTVWVAHTTTNDATWGSPFVPPVADTSITADDISSVVAWQGHVGVMWSNQNSGSFRFAVHRDGAPTNSWTLETALSGIGLADDHINLKTLASDASGRLHAAVKTGQDELATVKSTDPLVMVLTRSSTGTWSSAVAGTVASRHTKPMIMIDETNRELYFFARRGNQIMYKRSPLGDIVFPSGHGEVFMAESGTFLDSPSGSKQPLNSTTGVVVLASSLTNLFYYHGAMAIRPASDTVAPSVPESVVAQAVSASSVQLSWAASSDAVGVAGYRVFRDGVQVAEQVGTSFVDQGLTPSSVYSYEVAAFDAAGNVSGRSVAVRVSTPAAPEPIAFREASAGANSVDSALTIARPPGAQPGDLLLASIDVASKPTITAPAGWTLVRRDQVGNTMTKATYVKLAQQSEPPAYTWTLSSRQAAAGTLSAYVGVHATMPVEASAGLTSTSKTTSVITAPSVNVTAGAMVATLYGQSARTDITAPLTFDRRAQIVGGAGSTVLTTASADRRWTESGATGPMSATATTTAPRVAHTVALRPAG